MPKLNINDIHSVNELVSIAQKDLEGKTLLEIAVWINESDLISRVITKGEVGYLIEDGYFGIKANSSSIPDIKHLGVEIKTCPLTYKNDGKLRVKEPVSLNMINYNEEVEKKKIIDSSLYKKNKNILFVFYIHDESKKRSEYLIKYVFLWGIDSTVISDLEPDYQLILEKIRNGIAHQIHQSDHKWLTICPKHNGCFKDPLCTKSKTTQPFSNIPAEKRAFRLKNAYMNIIIRRYLKSYRPYELDSFVPD